jgi:hypothetical protein
MISVISRTLQEQPDLFGFLALGFEPPINRRFAPRGVGRLYYYAKRM